MADGEAGPAPVRSAGAAFARLGEVGGEAGEVDRKRFDECASSITNACSGESFGFR